MIKEVERFARSGNIAHSASPRRREATQVSDAPDAHNSGPRFVDLWMISVRPRGADSVPLTAIVPLVVKMLVTLSLRLADSNCPASAVAITVFGVMWNQIPIVPGTIEPPTSSIQTSSG